MNAIIPIFSTILVIAACMFVSNLYITFKPFKITFDWLPLIAAVFFLLTFIFMYMGYKKGKIEERKDEQEISYLKGQKDAYTDIANKLKVNKK